MPAIIAAQSPDALSANVSAKHVDRPMTQGTDTAEAESQWKVFTGGLPCEGRIYFTAVDSLRGKVISLLHDNPESGHFGALKTTELVSRYFYWPVMDSGVRKYVSGCEVCHRIKAQWHARHVITMTLEAPSRPWQGITMDFDTDLSGSTASGYTGIIVIVD